MIAERWDAAGAYELGRAFPGISWLQWNSRFRDDVRRFVRGDAGMTGALMQRIYGSDEPVSRRRDRRLPRTRASTTSRATTVSRSTIWSRTSASTTKPTVMKATTAPTRTGARTAGHDPALAPCELGARDVLGGEPAQIARRPTRSAAISRSGAMSSNPGTDHASGPRSRSLGDELLAPDVDAATVDRARPLVDQLDLESMDYQSFLAAIAARFAIEVQEHDLPRLRTIHDLAAYVGAKRR